MTNDGLRRAWTRWSLAAFVLLSSAHILIQSRLDSEVYPALTTIRTAEIGRKVGLYLRDHAPPDALLAANTVGAIPYYSKLRTIDMLGLTDAHIAHRPIPHMGYGPTGHEKGDGAYVLSLRPDYILFGPPMGSLNPTYLSDREIALNPTFSLKYTPKEVQIEDIRLRYYELKPEYRTTARSPRRHGATEGKPEGEMGGQ